MRARYGSGPECPAPDLWVMRPFRAVHCSEHRPAPSSVVLLLALLARD